MSLNEAIKKYHIGLEMEPTPVNPLIIKNTRDFDSIQLKCLFYLRSRKFITYVTMYYQDYHYKPTTIDKIFQMVLNQTQNVNASYMEWFDFNKFKKNDKNKTIYKKVFATQKIHAKKFKKFLGGLWPEFEVYMQPLKALKAIEVKDKKEDSAKTKVDKLADFYGSLTENISNYVNYDWAGLTDSNIATLNIEPETFSNVNNHFDDEPF